MEVTRDTHSSSSTENKEKEERVQRAEVFRRARQVDKDLLNGVLNGDAEYQQRAVVRELMPLLPAGVTVESVLDNIVLPDGRIPSWKTAIEAVCRPEDIRKRDIGACVVTTELNSTGEGCDGKVTGDSEIDEVSPRLA